MRLYEVFKASFTGTDLITTHLEVSLDSRPNKVLQGVGPNSIIR